MRKLFLSRSRCFPANYFKETEQVSIQSAIMSAKELKMSFARKMIIGVFFTSLSLNAITPEQQKELDALFLTYKDRIEQNSSLSDDRKKEILENIMKDKREIEKLSDEEISIYLDKNSGDSERIARAKEKESEMGKKVSFKSHTKTYSDEWFGWVLGSVGARYTTFLGGNSGGANMMFATLGMKYNFSKKKATLLPEEGFSLSIPIGVGAINTSRNKNYSFALPIALEAKYMFSTFEFGLSAGLRYTYSPQELGDLHIMDVYAGMDIYYGIFIEAGYVFYSSQDVTIGNRTISTDPLSGAITLNMGWRF